MLPVVAWQNFYAIVGSSAGALVGLQFVVMAFVGSARKRVDADAINAFGTPIVVNFSAALALSAIMCAPWPTPFATSAALVVCALAGLAYTAITVRRACRQTHYRPIFEDWLCYTSCREAFTRLLCWARFPCKVFRRSRRSWSQAPR